MSDQRRKGKLTIEVVDAGISVDPGPFNIDEAMGLIEWTRTVLRCQAVNVISKPAEAEQKTDDES